MYNSIGCWNISRTKLQAKLKLKWRRGGEGKVKIIISFDKARDRGKADDWLRFDDTF